MRAPTTHKCAYVWACMCARLIHMTVHTLSVSVCMRKSYAIESTELNAQQANNTFHSGDLHSESQIHSHTAGEELCMCRCEWVKFTQNTNTFHHFESIWMIPKVWVVTQRQCMRVVCMRFFLFGILYFVFIILFAISLSNSFAVAARIHSIHIVVVVVFFILFFGYSLWVCISRSQCYMLRVYSTRFWYKTLLFNEISHSLFLSNSRNHFNFGWNKENYKHHHHRKTQQINKCGCDRR